MIVRYCKPIVLLLGILSSIYKTLYFVVCSKALYNKGHNSYRYVFPTCKQMVFRHNILIPGLFTTLALFLSNYLRPLFYHKFRPLLLKNHKIKTTKLFLWDFRFVSTLQHYSYAHVEKAMYSFMVNIINVTVLL